MKYLLILITATIITSCASITQGTTQLLSFSIDPVEATCKVFTDDGTQIGSISGKQNMIQVSKDNNLPRIMSIQNGYNLVNRVFDISTSEVSLRENCGLLAYSPIAGGRLSGKYSKGKKPKKTRFTLWPKRFSRHNTKRGEIAIEKYLKISKKYQISPVKLAHAFVLSRPYLTSNIIGATSVKNLEENISSIKIKLNKEILDDIEDIHLSDPNPCV